jgi:hypothetical protein
MSSQPQPPRRGRPPKPGRRVRLNTVVPAPLYSLLESDATENGMKMSERLAEILAAFYSGQEAMPKAS